MQQTTPCPCPYLRGWPAGSLPGFRAVASDRRWLDDAVSPSSVCSGNSSCLMDGVGSPSHRAFCLLAAPPPRQLPALPTPSPPRQPHWASAPALPIFPSPVTGSQTLWQSCPPARHRVGALPATHWPAPLSPWSGEAGGHSWVHGWSCPQGSTYLKISVGLGFGDLPPVAQPCSVLGPWVALGCLLRLPEDSTQGWAGDTCSSWGSLRLRPASHCPLYRQRPRAEAWHVRGVQIGTPRSRSFPGRERPPPRGSRPPFFGPVGAQCTETQWVQAAGSGPDGFRAACTCWSSNRTPRVLSSEVAPRPSPGVLWQSPPPGQHPSTVSSLPAM